MPCTCGSPDCPATHTEAPSTPVVINVLAEAATVEGRSDKPGYLPGYGAIPAATVQQLAKTASLRPVPLPKDLVAEPQYRPSAALARFIGCRDLTCRWPGCDQPAVASDIDHTVPYPVGPTHPSSNKLYCRIHPPPKTVNHSRTRVNRCRARLKGARATRQAVPRQAGPVPRIVATAPCKVPASLYVNSRVPRSGTIRPFL
jgi:hypothetical protein